MTTDPEILKLRKTLVGYALAIATEDYRMHLDFSEASIRVVDKILNKIHKDYRRNPDIDEERKLGLYGIALEMGAYITEVIERNYKFGEWHRDDPNIGEETWPFVMGNYSIFPVAWCVKHIYDGKSDSVTYKYQHAFLDKLPELQTQKQK